MFGREREESVQSRVCAAKGLSVSGPLWSMCRKEYVPQRVCAAKSMCRKEYVPQRVCAAKGLSQCLTHTKDLRVSGSFGALILERQ